MDIFYWIYEYMGVLWGYLFLMFLWPQVVFGSHLKKKKILYRFGFCVTVQPIIISTVVLGLGLFHILKRQAVMGIFFGIFFVILLYKAACGIVRMVSEAMGDKVNLAWKIRIRIKEYLWDALRKIKPRFLEYFLLLAVVIYGVAYFSYGAFQVHSYGYGDLYAHHAWIYGLTEGQIFSDGVYPEAMHCFIYCLNVLFDIPVFTILLYLQCIHVAVFLIAAYCLFREIFHWRYMPVLVLMVFLTLDVVSADMVYSMSRLQWVLPLEFGLHTQFLCALFLLRYFKHAGVYMRQRKNSARAASRFFWDENLFLFMLALTASIAIHFYVTIMAFIVCFSFAVCSLRKIFNRRYLIPLVTVTLCGVLAAVAPMAAALASGIPFNYSIRWAMESMDGSKTREFEGIEEDSGNEEGTEGGTVTEGDGADLSASSRGNAKLFQGTNFLYWLADTNLEGAEELIGDGAWSFGEKLRGLYDYGYQGLYGAGRAKAILALTVISTLLCILGKWKKNGILSGMGSGYAPVILISILFVITYAMPYVGWPEIISDSRFCSTGNMMILAVALMPVDAAFSVAAAYGSDIVLQAVSCISVLGIYAAAVFTGNYRGYLFYELTRYDAAVMVTNLIIETFPEKSFVIVSPTDELYPVIQDGWHEELLTFLEMCGDEDYMLLPEYVFIYVEKKPLLYAQSHFFTGPGWMAQEKYKDIYWEKYSKRYPDSGASQSPDILASEISDEEIGKEMTYSNGQWGLYTLLGNRTILESRMYKWCQKFMELYPYELNVYYEDEDFVCYYLMQDPNNPYKLKVE